MVLFSTKDWHSLRTFPDENFHFQMLVLLEGDPQLFDTKQKLWYDMGRSSKASLSLAVRMPGSFSDTVMLMQPTVGFV